MMSTTEHTAAYQLALENVITARSRLEDVRFAADELKIRIALDRALDDLDAAVRALNVASGTPTAPLRING